MKRLVPVLATLAIAACSEGGDPVQMALRDAAAARQAAAVKAGVNEAPMEATATPQTGDAAYVAGMIEHHRAALKLAVDALARSDDPEIRRMAQTEIDSRTREIASLQAWAPSAPLPTDR